MKVSLVMEGENAARLLIEGEAALGDLSPVITAIAGEVDDRVQTAFENKADPVNGQTWPELATATLKDRERKGFNKTDILQRTRILRAGVIAEVDGNAIKVSAGSVEYAGVHQYGYDGWASMPSHTRTITKAFGKDLKAPVTYTYAARSQKLTIPQRRFAGVSPEDVGQFEEMLINHIAGA